MTETRSRLLAGAIILFTFISRAVTFLCVYSIDPSRIMQPDSATYEKPAYALIEARAFASDPHSPDRLEVTRTPGYPAFIALAYACLGADRRAVILLQIAVSGATAGLFYLFVARVWTARVALLAALILALDPVSFLYSQLMLSETLFAFFIVLTAALGARLIRGRPAEVAWAFALGAAASLAALVRPLAYYLIAPLLLGMAIVKKRGRSWRGLCGLLALTALPWAVLVAGWQLRNKRVSGSAEFSLIQSYNLLFYRGGGIIAARDGISLEAAQQNIRATMPDPNSLSIAEASDSYRREGLALIGAHPAIFLKTECVGLLKMMVGPVGSELRRYLGLETGESGPAGDLLRLSLGDYLQKWVLNYPAQFLLFCFESLFLALLYGGSALAAPAAFQDREHRTVHGYLIGIILYLILLSAGPEAYARFRVPLMPFLALYAALGIGSILGGRRSSPGDAGLAPSS